MNKTTPRLAIVMSRFNVEGTSGLLNGALAYLAETGLAAPHRSLTPPARSKFR